METGDMNQRITFQALTTSVNANGLETNTWSDYYTCWCYANGLSGTEFWSAQQVQAENTVQFYVRYCTALKTIDTKNYRIMFDSVPYDIKHIDNMKFANDIIKIKALAHSQEVD